MTGNLYLDLAISLVGVGLVVLISYFLGAWRSVKVTEAAAADRLAFDEPDFAPERWMIGVDGAVAAALAKAGGEIALVFSLGDRLVSRRLPALAVKCSARDGTLVFELGEPSKRAIRLVAASSQQAGEWARALGCIGR
ncbi:MAG: hypothetical protein KDA46_10390 [Parvularculaceae bacterium]|nr:hypothetical protein [Parvularculaceae bacterium]